MNSMVIFHSYVNVYQRVPYLQNNLSKPMLEFCFGRFPFRDDVPVFFRYVPGISIAILGY